MNQDLELMVTGDLHLGVHPSSIPDELDSDEFSPGTVWRRIVEEAVSRSVDAVIITGDVVDRRNRIFEAWGPFEAGITELSKAEIPLVMVAGNHDAEVLPDFVDSVQNSHCHLIGRGGDWERWTLEYKGTPRLHLDGWSYPRQHVRRNPLDDYDLPDADEPTVGLLHTELNGTDSPYAPVDLGELKQSSADAWLLGHVHKPGVRSENPLVLYPGSPQPLDPSETGPHGSWIVTVKPSGTMKYSQRTCSTLQYESVDLDGSDVPSLERLPSLMKSCLDERVDRRMHESDPLQLVLTRLVLSGRVDWFRSLEEDRTRLRDSLELHTGDISLRVHEIENQTKPPIDLEPLRDEASPVGLLADLLVSLENEEYEKLPEELLHSMEEAVRRAYDARAYEPLRVHGEFDPPDHQAQLEILTRQARILLDQLLRQKDDRP